MLTLQNNTASDHANSTAIEQIGLVAPADPMNCAVIEAAVCDAFDAGAYAAHVEAAAGALG